MENISNIIILVFFLLEVVILFLCEKKLWGTIYTPLNILMLPYTFVLIITIMLPESLGFVHFYYPSIFIWAIGLIVFFIPSALLGLNPRRQFIFNSLEIIEPKISSVLNISLVFLFIFLFHIVFGAETSVNIIGSDDFADEFVGYGIWGHLREALLSILIILIFLYRKENQLFLFFIFAILFIAVVYQVKGWILIPLTAGFLTRFYTKKAVLKFKYFILIIVVGFGIFFLSYYLLLVFSGGNDYSSETFDYIFMHFVHYLTSGTFGLSLDNQLGFLEQPNLQSIFAPFVNVINLIKGDQFISPINSVYLDTGWDGTNVRTFFGTLFINAGWVYSVIYILFLSLILYLMQILVFLKKDIFILAIYCWWCALLSMGWFEFYFFHLTVIEVPIWLLILSLVTKIEWKLKKDYN